MSCFVDYSQYIGFKLDVAFDNTLLYPVKSTSVILSKFVVKTYFIIIRMSSENVSGSSDVGTLQLPISRIKTIMKSSPEVSAIGTESLFLIAKATVRSNLILNY